MEAEHSRLTEGEQSGGQPSQQQQQQQQHQQQQQQQHHLSEPQLIASLPHSPVLKSQQRAASRSAHGSFGRRQHRQPKRSDLLQGLHQQHQQHQQQQRNQVSEAGTASWQLQNVSGPSSSSFRSPLSVTSSSTVSSSSSLVQPSQGASSQQGQEGQEGATPSRRERKPQKLGKYVCSYCGRPCAKPSVLQKHIRSHTGERPYPCVPCGFSFKTKSNLYKHRKSHAHRIKVGTVSGRDEHGLSGPEGGAGGDEQGDPTEGESTDSEDETGHHHPSTSQDRPTLKKSSHVELSFSEDTLRPEAVKQRLAMRLSERNRLPKALPDEHTSSLGPGSKGSTESGYYSLSGSSDLSQVSSPNANAKSYAEIILGKYGRLGQQPRSPQPQPSSSSSSLPPGQEDKTIPFTVPKTQVIEHITKLITINEAVVDTSEIDSVKPRRSSLSRRDSIELPKFSSSKEIGDAGTITGHSSHGIYSSDMLSPMSSDSESLSSQGLSTALLRSHSMPSPAGQEDPASTSSCSFRLCQSFDDQQGREMRVGHHHRMLRRQPAIEVPPGGELFTPESGVSTSVAKDAELGLRQFRGLIYDCEACGTSWKKRESYEAHRELCVGQLSQELPKGKEGSAFREDRPQMMQNKFTALAMAMRKRRKEESLEEDPPSPGPTAVTFSHVAMKSLPGVEKHTDPIGVICEAEQERKTTWKEISVIQHTSSFEKQESMSMESQETESEEQHQPTEQQPKSSPTTSRLVRQSNIQVPEILVTEEPDTDMVLSSPPAVASSSKEPEKVEEFQWPQRSQSLAQLPAEKLPPKKKRLRLAEASQSSGESSFESASLSRSPSQESSVSHTSSRSASFEDSCKPESETLSVKGSHGSHMLTVPSGHHQHHHSHREMRRSASEQTPPSPPHPSQIVESRSKSFDYGSLSPQQSSASWKERRKNLLMKHATLGEPDQEDISTGQLIKPGSPKVYRSYPSPPTFVPEEHSMTSISTSTRLSSESIGKTLQLFQPPLLPIPQTSLPFHPVGPEAFSHRQLTRFLPVTTAISDVLSNQILHRAFLQAPPPQFHPAPLNIAERLGFPLQPLQSLLPLHGQSGITQAVYFPMPGGLTIQVPAEPPYRDPRPSSATGHRSGPGNQQLMPSHSHPRPIIAPCLEQLTPVVSLVVPVRLQTHIPTYASAMYTTLSQILVTTRPQEPICCTAMVIMGKLGQGKLQRSYLKIPSPCLPMSLEYSAAAGSDEGPLGAGGSKRMLSPAGSLELTSEAQRQQKRVKEEEEEDDDDDDDEEEEEEEKEDKGRRKGLTLLEKKKDPERHLKVEQVKEKSRVVEEATQEGGGKVEMKVREKATRETRQESLVDVQTPKKEEREEESHGKTPWIEGVERSKQPTYPSLHTATSVSWCYLNYIKPNPTTQQDPQTSVYSSWSISVHNPNLPGLTTKVVLSLLRSKQKHSLETYTMAMAPPPTAGKLVPSSNRNPRVSEVRSAPASKHVKVKEEPSQERKETKAKSEEEAPSTSKQGEPSRVRIFEGGYKSNEEYVYVRGRGRGKYVCGECGIRCKKPSMLKKHIRTHTDVRPYVCKHCNFAFKTKGNLTKHMKSKAHSKKCLEMGISGSSLDDPDEAGGSEEPTFGSEDPEEHQFSDVDDSEEGEDNEEEDDDCSSHDDPPSSCSTDTRPSTSGQSDSSQSLQLDLLEHSTFPGSAGSHDYPSPRRPWPGARAASPGSKRAMFSRRRWEASPRAFSPAQEGGSGSSLCSLSPRLELSSPSRHLSPSPERGPSPSSIRPLSPLRPLSPIRPLSPGRYRSSRALLTPSPLRAQHYRHHSSPAHLPWDSTGTQTRSEPRQERPGTPREGLALPEPAPFPPVLRLPSSSNSGFGSGFGSMFGSEPVPSGAPRTVDHMFSHLPLHSQDQARMPYHMIPIGGIQMVQALPRAKLERSPSSTASSPTSPKEDIALFYATSPGPSSTRTPKDSKFQTSQEGISQPGPGFQRICTTLPTPASLQPGEPKPDATERKQHGSSLTSPRDTHSLVTERTDAPEQITDRLSDLRVSPFSSNQRTRQLSERVEPPPVRGPSLAERQEEGGSSANGSRRGSRRGDT